jgi:hypothetical protein
LATLAVCNVFAGFVPDPGTRADSISYCIDILLQEYCV